MSASVSAARGGSRGMPAPNVAPTKKTRNKSAHRAVGSQGGAATYWAMGAVT